MDLIKIKEAIQKKTFSPIDWIPQRLKEQQFDIAIGAWLDHFKVKIAQGKRSPGTIMDYKGYAENYFKPFFDTQNITQLAERIEEFADSLATKNLKIKTQKNIMNALKTFLRWALKKKAPFVPPVEGDDSGQRTAIAYEDQADALSKIPDKHRDVIEFGFETGLRPGETCALKIKDFDFQNRQATIQRTWTGPHLREATKGKNKKIIPLSDTAYEIAFKHAEKRFPEDFLFINPDTGRCYRQKKLNNIWKTYGGLSVVHYEASRHSFVTQLVEAGHDLAQVKELARHSDIRTTLRYTHLRTVKLRDIVNQRGKIIDFPKVAKGEDK